MLTRYCRPICLTVGDVCGKCRKCYANIDVSFLFANAASTSVFLNRFMQVFYWSISHSTCYVKFVPRNRPLVYIEFTFASNLFHLTVPRSVTQTSLLNPSCNLVPHIVEVQRFHFCSLEFPHIHLHIHHSQPSTACFADFLLHLDRYLRYAKMSSFL